MVPFKEVNKRQSSLTRNCLLSSSPFALSWTVSSGEVNSCWRFKQQFCLHVSLDSNVKCAIKEKESNDHLRVTLFKGIHYS